MRPETRDTVMRLLLAALLNSRLSARELREFADEIIGNASIGFHFGKLIQDVVTRLDESGAVKRVERLKENVGDEDEAYATVQRRRLSKRGILDRMAAVVPPSNVNFSAEKMTVREILAKFFRAVTPEERKKFMALIESTDAGDAYLSGIVQRR